MVFTLYEAYEGVMGMGCTLIVRMCSKEWYWAFITYCMNRLINQSFTQTIHSLSFFLSNHNNLWLYHSNNSMKMWKQQWRNLRFLLKKQLRWLWKNVKYKVIILIINNCEGYDLSKIDTSKEAVLFNTEEAISMANQIKSSSSFVSMKSIWDSICCSPLLCSYLDIFINQ